MLASDLRRLELIGVDEKTGFPMFGPARFIIFGVKALARLQMDLIDSLGLEKAAIIYSRHGYECGMTMAIGVSELYDFDNTEELLKAGCALQAMCGLAHVTIQEIAHDPVKKSLRFSGTWNDSFESTMWLSQFEPSTRPVCCIVSGMLSGYASAVMGTEVLVREVSCQAEGQTCCRFEGRTLPEWGLDPNEVQRLFAVDKIGEEVARLRRELEQAREDLARQNTEIKVLKTLTFRAEPDREIVCRSAAMSRLLIMAKKVASTRATVLIQGGERHRQGGPGPPDPPPLRERGEVFSRHQLCGPPPEPPRIGVVRPCQRGLYRGDCRQAGTLR